jgi:hypothetical protein
MTMYRSLLLVVVFSITVSRVARSQRVTDPLIGSRVRLDTASGSRVLGTLVSIDADTLRLAGSGAGATIAVPRALVISFEVSAGRERGRGARRGAIAGGAVGLALIVASLRNDTVTVNRQSSDLHVAVPVAIGLVALGAGIGAAVAPERWESPGRVSARARLRLAACHGECLAFRYWF